MLFPTRFKNYRSLMAIGMMCLAVGTTFRYFFHPSSQVGLNWLEGARGMMYGLSIGFNIWAVRLGALQRRCRGKSEGRLAS